jgi:type I restriction enzyme M protein
MGSVSSAGEFYTPKQVGMVMAHPRPRAGLDRLRPLLRLGRPAHQVPVGSRREDDSPLAQELRAAPSSTAQEYTPETWAMTNMNMIIHDMQGQSDSFKNPKFRKGNHLQTFDRGSPTRCGIRTGKETDYDNDELDRFPKGAGFPGRKASSSS